MLLAHARLQFPSGLSLGLLRPKHFNILPHFVSLEPITIEQDLTFESKPIQILERSERVLRNKTLKYVKILWSQQTEREATWDLESRMREQYPELFTAGMH